MNISNTYLCFNEKGEASLPDNKLIDKLINNGTKPVVFIDSCVCLHIVKLIDHGKKANGINKKKILWLKEYVTKNKIKVNPLFGLMELCSTKGKIDNTKFWDLYKRIDFFNLIPIKQFKTFNYNFHQQYFLDGESYIQDKENSFFGLDAFFLNTYTSLLKIRELSLKGVSKKYAEPHALEFVEWMKKDLGIILGVEYRLAMNVFGGITEFRKMIWLEGKTDILKKKLIGTAWDITHSRFCSNNVLLSRTLGEYISAYFLTSDLNLFNLLASYQITMLIDGGNSGCTTMYNTDFELPHFNESFIDKNNRMIIDISYERLGDEIVFDRDKIWKIIDELEMINNIA